MHFTLLDEQERVVQEACKFYKNSYDQVFQIAGGSGRGKSVVMGAIRERLNLPFENIIPMAYTGAAALVMRTKGFLNAKSIHSSLYEPIEKYKVDMDGNLIIDEYFNRPTYEIGFKPIDTSYASAFFIDEGGTVPYKMKFDIESRNKKIFVAGDLDQLPPVKDKPAYLVDGTIHELHQPMRQALDSGIFYISERARLGLPIHKGWYGNAIVIDEDELNDDMIRRSDILICSINKTRDKWNNYVRHEILGINQDLPINGERMICRKNNWMLDLNGINLVNGLIGSVYNYPNVSSFNGETFNIDFKPYLCNNYFCNLPVDYKYFTAPHDLKEKIKQNKFSRGEKFEFAYCISTYLSQGSEFANVIYFEEPFFKDIETNTNYVGASRAKSFLIYVLKKRRYYY